MNTDIRVFEVEPFFTHEKSRTPLKFGGVVIDEIVYCHVRVTVENRLGRRADGWGAIFMADGWSWPSSKVSHEVREELMRKLVVAWCRKTAETTEYAHPIDLFWSIEPELAPLAERISQDEAVAEPMPRLAALVCASPVDAAVHDAFGKAAGIDTYDGYGANHMDHDLSRWLGPEFQGRYIADYLSPMPEWIDAFHLIGGLDKLTESEITSDDPDDGLPVSLDQWIRYEGLHCLKVKLRGIDLQWDLDRLLSIATVARQEHQKLGINELWLTADTNEMCQSAELVIGAKASQLALPFSVQDLTNGRIHTSTIHGPGFGYRFDEINRHFEIGVKPQPLVADHHATS